MVALEGERGRDSCEGVVASLRIFVIFRPSKIQGEFGF
jgi:hypothetical protein